jgi:integrase
MAEIKNRGRNTWLVRIFMGRHPLTGKTQYENKTIHGTKRDAEQWAAERERDRDLGVAAPSKATMSDLFDSLLLDYKVNAKDLKWADGIVRNHLRPFFGAMRIGKVDTDAVKRYTAERQKGKAANATINRELAILKRSFHLGRKATPPKVARVPYIPMLKENNVRKGFFEQAEFRALLNALPEEIAAIVSFAYFTACRREEVLALRWRQVDLTAGFVHLEKGATKNGDARMIPLVPELVELLTRLKSLRDAHFPKCDFVFSRDGQQIRDFRGAWMNACVQCGFVDANGKPDRLFHDLRRSGVRNLVRAGVSDSVAMKISGHKTRAVFDRYDITALDDLRNAVAKLSTHSENLDALASSSHTIVTQAPN